MRFIKGTELNYIECGGNYRRLFVVGKADLESHPRGVAEPVGSFRSAACYIAREAIDGRTVDVRIVAKPAQQWWDSMYDQMIIVPTKGGTIGIETLTTWFNVYTRSANIELNRTVLNTMWRKACKHAGSSSSLMAYIRDYVSKHPKVLGLNEDDDLRVV